MWGETRPVVAGQGRRGASRAGGGGREGKTRKTSGRETHLLVHGSTTTHFSTNLLLELRYTLSLLYLLPHTPVLRIGQSWDRLGRVDLVRRVLLGHHAGLHAGLAHEGGIELIGQHGEDGAGRRDGGGVAGRGEVVNWRPEGRAPGRGTSRGMGRPREAAWRGVVRPSTGSERTASGEDGGIAGRWAGRWWWEAT